MRTRKSRNSTKRKPPSPLVRLMYESSAVTAPDEAVSTVRSCAAAPAGSSSAAVALASEPKVVRRRGLDTMISVEERHRLAHLEYAGAGAVPDVVAQRLRVADIGRDQHRAPILVAAIDPRVELFQPPLVLLRDGE